MANKNPHKGHRVRLKKELIASDFSDNIEIHKMLEALLFYGVPQKDTNELAHQLLDKFGSFCGVLDADVNDLYQVKGMTEHSATLIKLILPLARRYSIEKYKGNYKFGSIDEIGEFLVSKHRGYSTEVFMVTTFKDDGTKIACDIINKGDMESVSASVKEIVSCVIRHNAPSVIVSHNHINNVAVPSRADLEITRTLVCTFYQLGIRMLDHIIVADNDFVSLSQSKEYHSLFIIKQTN